jgi:hypothetical protein
VYKTLMMPLWPMSGVAVTFLMSISVIRFSFFVSVGKLFGMDRWS